MAGEIISEQWARSSRNGGQHHPGIAGGFTPESAQLTVTQANGAIDMPFLWRFGWAAGTGVELQLARSWTAGLE